MTSTYETLRSASSRPSTPWSADADPVLRTSDRRDYQANGVMALAKRLGRPPREVADEVVGSSTLTGWLGVEVAGPGFLNLTLDSAFLDRQLVGLARDARLGMDSRRRPGAP